MVARPLEQQMTDDQLGLTLELESGLSSEAPPMVSAEGYRFLGEFRYEMRKFLAFSERAARAAGIEPQQHQLLLAIKGLPVGVRPTIRSIAQRLCVQHHTAVALVDKLEKRMFVVRERNTTDRREVLLRLTPSGEAILMDLSKLHQVQLAVTGVSMVDALSAIIASAGVPVLTESPSARRYRRSAK